EEAGGVCAAEIPADISWTRAVALTAAALQAGAAVVYQAALQSADGEWGGRADFLIRVDRPSALGFWSYEAVETKLARSTKAPALIQLSLYSELLQSIQGIEPERMHLVLRRPVVRGQWSVVRGEQGSVVRGQGSGVGEESQIADLRFQSQSFQVKRFAAYLRRVKRELQEADGDAETYPEPNEHCSVCSWSSHCDAEWRRDDHLSLVARITRNQRRALVERGVGTVAALGALVLPVDPKIERIGEAALETIREQARRQVQGREQGRPIYEPLPLAGERLGLAALPEPSPGDIFFDFEGAPFALDDGLEYLFGIATLHEDSGAAPVYEAIWALDRVEERRAFEQFIAMVTERWARYPGMHIYHYAPYEPTAIKRLAGRHGICVDEVDRLLRAGIFVDLYHIVRQSLRASVESYSIKKLEPLYSFDRATQLQDANFALKAFEAVLAFWARAEHERESRRRDAIQSYNRDDCMSTLRLRDWLEEIRRERERETGQAIARPAAESGDPTEGVAAQLERTIPLVAGLLKDLPEDESEWNEDQGAR